MLLKLARKCLCMCMYVYSVLLCLENSFWIVCFPVIPSKNKNCQGQNDTCFVMRCKKKKKPTPKKLICKGWHRCCSNLKRICQTWQDIWHPCYSPHSEVSVGILHSPSTLTSGAVHFLRQSGGAGEKACGAQKGQKADAIGLDSPTQAKGPECWHKFLRLISAQGSSPVRFPSPFLLTLKFYIRQDVVMKSVHNKSLGNDSTVLMK